MIVTTDVNVTKLPCASVIVMRSVDSLVTGAVIVSCNVIVSVAVTVLGLIVLGSAIVADGVLSSTTGNELVGSATAPRPSVLLGTPPDVMALEVSTAELLAMALEGSPLDA